MLEASRELVLESGASLRPSVEAGVRHDGGDAEEGAGFEFAASARSNAMVRLVFSQPENLLMSRYGQEFYSEFPERKRIAGERPVLDYHRGGLLVIGNDAHQAEDIAINAALQQGLGAAWAFSRPGRSLSAGRHSMPATLSTPSIRPMPAGLIPMAP